MLATPPLLHILENVSHPGALERLRDFYKGPAANFRVYIDDACRQPGDWRATWDRPRQWGLTGEKNWATKYGAAGFIPRMIDRSPFATEDWRSASASVVVLFARQYAGGPAIVQQQCLQRLRAHSPAFKATNGSRHFFIFTDSRGPCCLDGKYKDVGFLGHHIIGPHGEPPQHHNGKSAWFFRRGRGPKIRCFDPLKDINIPTPNIHFPRTPFAPTLRALPGGAADARTLLLFYAGWNYDVRMKLVKMYQADPEVYVRKSVPPEEYVEKILTSKFCPVSAPAHLHTEHRTSSPCAPAVRRARVRVCARLLLSYARLLLLHDGRCVVASRNGRPASLRPCTTSACRSSFRR